MKIFEPTNEQKKAINSSAKKTVVSASAGSGKTSTMIDKIVSLIANDKAEISQILCITFTTASAADMRAKLYKALIKLSPSHQNCKKALFEIATADICTIDSFCKKLVTKYFYLLDIEQNFRLLSTNELEELKHKSLAAVVDRLVSDADSQFFAFAKNNWQKRNIEAIKKLVYRVYDFLQTSEQRHSVIDNTEQAHRQDLDKNFAVNVVVDFAKMELKKHIEQVKNFAAGLDKELSDYCNGYIEQAEAVVALTNLEQFITNIISIKRDNVTKKIYGSNKEQKEEVSQFFEQHKLTNIKKLFEGESADGIKDSLKTSFENAKFLHTLTLEFEKEYMQNKKRLSSFEFADIQAFARNILSYKEVQEQIASKYKYVFVDEFQDVNGMQDAIIKNLDASIFVVGDVKQSIYGFRLTDPNIFIGRFDEAKNSKKDIGEAIDLSANFRSTEQILKFCNYVFCPVMNEDNCGINYSNSGKFAFDGEQRQGPNVQIVAIKKECEDEEEPEIVDITNTDKIYSPKTDETQQEDNEAANAESIVVGNILTDLLESGRKPQDIAILCRSFGDYTKRVVKNLQSFGFMLNVNFDDDITQKRENNFLHNFLRLLDNAWQDKYLIAVLLSPFFGFSAQDLYEMRSKAPKECKHFFECFWQLKNQPKISKFFDTIKEFLDFARNNSLFELVKKIITYFDYFVYVNDIGGDEQAVVQFLDFVKGENIQNTTQYAGVTDDFANKIKASNAAVEGKITVSTIHSAKGLEYDAVVLVGSGVKYNDQDIREQSFVDTKIGIATNCIDYDSGIDINTMTKKAAKILAQKRNTAEELRILYVALTRAKDYLAITGSVHEKTVLHASPDKTKFVSNIEVMLSAITQSKREQLLHGKIITLDNCADVKLLKLNDINKQWKDKGDFELKICVDKKLIDEYKAAISKLRQKASIITKTSVTKQLEGTNIEWIVDSSRQTDEQKEAAILSGTCYHEYFENFDFINKKSGMQTLPQNLEQKYIDKFLNSEIFEIIKNGKILKEQKFVFRLDSGSLLQGIVDFVCVFDDGFIVVDYKFSNTMREQYKEQIRLYCHALEQILQKKCKNGYIYLIKSGQLQSI